MRRVDGTTELANGGKPEPAERDVRRATTDLAELRQRLLWPAPDRADGTDHIRLSDEEHADHVNQVAQTLADAKAARPEGRFAPTIDSKGEIWSDARSAAHDQILDDLYSRSAAVPCEGRAVVAGGLPGSGKTTVLREYAGIDPSRYLMTNPDIMKAELARRGLVPQVPGLSPMEATELVHEESSYLAKRLAQRAQADRRNIIWDVTLCKPDSAASRIDSLRASGYTRVEGIFVDIPVDQSVRRADLRYREENEQYRAGGGLGGRLVPAEVIRAQTDFDWGSRNRANFEQIKDKFDAWSVYDNSGSAPVLVQDDSRGYHEKGVG